MSLGTAFSVTASDLRHVAACSSAEHALTSGECSSAKHELNLRHVAACSSADHALTLGECSSAKHELTSGAEGVDLALLDAKNTRHATQGDLHLSPTGLPSCPVSWTLSELNTGPEALSPPRTC